MNNSKDQFFIGWKGDVSDQQKKWIKRILIPIFITIPIIIFGIVMFANPFNNNQFELGNVQEFTGVYHEEPFPVLLIDEGQVQNGISTSALLVGYGKNGAKTFLYKAEESKGDLSGKRIKIQGTLIYGDGKTLIELTKKEDSVIEILEDQIQKNDKPKYNQGNFEGEIIDPKCWFGVMKPAEGKVHKSCAIRCISGGIPPVLKTKNHKGDYDYYILKGINLEDINEKVLEFVGEQIKVEMLSFKENGWNVARIDTRGIKYLE